MTELPKPPKLTFATVYPNEVPVSYMDSWTNFLMFDVMNWGVLAGENSHGRITVRYGTDGLVAARNEVVRQFLETPNDYLLWVDADMGFDPLSVYKLLEIAVQGNLPIVGGLCFASREVAHDGLNGYRTVASPTIFQPDIKDGHETVSAGHMYPVNSLVRCSATGSAFILIHRRVFETIGSGWYERIPNGDGTYKGEDVSFCLRAQEAGFPVHVFTGAKTSHFKPQWVSEWHYWRAVTPPPATDEVAVIVPVLKRPEHAEPFMQSLVASTGLATAYAICDEDDGDAIKAWTDAGALVIIRPSTDEQPGSFAEKVNLGYQQTAEPWLFIVGSDVRFHPGWLDHAQHLANTWQACVVGTNDLGNPRVVAGEHATHLLVARDYVDELGASWDGPGVLAHEGYRHWYVDDEVVEVAKQRGKWTMALGSIVEHLHPAWGKGENDEVYELGQSFADQDGKRFEERCAKYL